MSVVGRNLDDVVTLSELTTLLIKYNSIFVERLSLLDNGALALKRFLRVQSVILAEAELVAMRNTLRANARQGSLAQLVFSACEVVESVATGAARSL